MENLETKPIKKKAKLWQIGLAIVFVLMVISAINSSLNKSHPNKKSKDDTWNSYSQILFQRGFDSLLSQKKYENNSVKFIWGAKWDNSITNSNNLIADGIPIEVHTWLEQGGIGSSNKGIPLIVQYNNGYDIPPLTGEPLTYSFISTLNEDEITLKIKYSDKTVAGISATRDVVFNFNNMHILDKEDLLKFQQYVKKVKLSYKQEKLSDKTDN